MSDFRQLSGTFWASPQITLSDVEEAKANGFALIVNNRPDGEADDQTEGAEIARAAKAAGIDYCAIPITQSGFSNAQVDALCAALDGQPGKVLGYCRSGTRSTLLWALAQAKLGGDPAKLADAAAAAGYDLTPVRPAMDMLAGSK